MTHTTIIESYNRNGCVLKFAITDECYNTDIFKLTVTLAGVIRVEKLVEDRTYNYIFPAEVITPNYSLEDIDETIQKVLIRCSKGDETELHVRDSVAYCEFLEDVNESFNN